MSTSTPPRPPKRPVELVLLAPLLVYAWAVLRTAWLSDDCFISFRAIENLVAGAGPRWNPYERVQVFSHPLWFLLLSSLRAVTGELFYTSLFLSIVLSIAAVAMLAWRGSAPWGRRFLVVAMLGSSLAFIDYSSSGLENPLSYFLLAIYFHFFIRRTSTGPKRLGWLSLILGLALMTRHDVALLYGPVYLVELIGMVRHPGDRTRGYWGRLIAALFLGFIPFIAWEICSLIYFGFPFPNTAYAKLATAIPKIDLLRQGGYYVLYLLKFDPLTAAVILSGIVAGALETSWRIRAFTFGLILQTAYVVWVGGDFMAGRFFSVPCFAAALILSEVSLGKLPAPGRWFGATVLVLLAVVSWLPYPFRTPVTRGPITDSEMEEVFWNGIIDERRFYYPYTGLMRLEPERYNLENYRFSKFAEEIRADAPAFVFYPTIGLQGWKLERDVAILDAFALSDPLLARIPVIQDPPWRIGHFARRVPQGYVESLLFGDNRIADPYISAFYDDIRLVTQAPVFSPGRFAAILRLNLNPLPHLENPEDYTHPGDDYRSPAHRLYRADQFLPRENRIHDLRSNESLAIYWPELRHETGLRIDPRPSMDFGVIVSAGGRDIANFMIKGHPARFPPHPDEDRPIALTLPASVSSAGYDGITFVPASEGGRQQYRSIDIFNPQ